MSRSLHVLLMAGAALAISVPAAAQDFGKRGSERVGRQLAAERGEAPMRAEGQAARREARQQQATAAPARVVPVPQVQAQAPASVGSVQAQSVRRNVAAETRSRPSWNRGDRDGDGVPNRRDIDRDGDGRPNWRDRDNNNDGRVDNRWRDRDRDGVPNSRDRDIDNDGRPNWRDRDANNDGRRDDRWRDRDRDRDGVPNHRDWDRDGDGKPNWRDGSKRHDPWRYWHRPRPSYVIVRPSPSYRYHPYWWGSSLFLFDDRYDRYGYDYGAYYRPGYGFYGAQLGSGWATLYPWLRQDPAARHWVMWNFDDNRNGRLGKDEARDANRAFDRLADRNRDGRISDREVRYAIDELRDEFRYSYRDGY